MSSITKARRCSLQASSSQGSICNTCKIAFSDILRQNFKEHWNMAKIRRRISRTTGIGHCYSYGSVQKLKLSAQEGCVPCFLAISALEIPEESSDWVTLVASYSSYYLVVVSKRLLSPKRFFAAQNEAYRGEVVLVKEEERAHLERSGENFELSLDVSLKRRLKSPLSPRSNSKTSFGLVVQWLNICRKSHTICNRKRGQKKLPTRVIDVGPRDGSREPYLLISGDLCGEYATLSHRWGEISKQFTTTNINVTSYRKGIGFRDLPATFRDAIVVTRELSLRYLWIDSICIIQDDPGDWIKECNQMSSIYEHSTITISALRAKDSYDGIFTPCTTHRYFELDANDAIAFRKPPLHFVQALHGSPMTGRGWILQERILSPSIVHYGEEQVFWECCEGSASENVPEIERNNFSVLKDYMEQTPKCILHEEGHFSAWYQISSTYNNLKLTVESDRILAIQGLADRFSKAFVVNYLAGLWLEDLHRGLLWWCGNVSRQDQHIAPSWSWLGYGKDLEFGWPEQEQPQALTVYPVVRVQSNYELEVIDAFVSQVHTVRGFIQTWGVLVKVDYVTTCRWASGAPFPVKYWDASWVGYINTRQKPKQRTGRLPCVIDFRCDSLKDCYCLVIADWLCRDFVGLGKTSQNLRFYLILQRIGRRRKHQHPLDAGRFKRIGMGAVTLSEARADEFFKDRTRKFVTLV